MKTLGLSLFLLFFSATAAFCVELPPLNEAKAFGRYKNRIKTELSQLVFLMERFNVKGIEIKIDGNVYPAALAFPFAKMYLALNYNKEKTKDWIQKHCYRSPFTNEVMLVRFNGGEYEVGRDALFRELDALTQAEREINAGL